MSDKLCRIAGVACLAVIAMSATASDDPYVQAQERVKYVLKDPDSAKFREMGEATNLAGIPAICGQVNSKNSYGGYTGFTGFAVVGSRVSMNESGELAAGYAESGCEGRDAELNARASTEAMFQCDVIERMVLDGASPGQGDAAVNAALSKVMQHAADAGHPMDSESVKLVRAQYNKLITGHPGSLSYSHASCYLDTVKAIKPVIEASFANHAGSAPAQ